MQESPPAPTTSTPTVEEELLSRSDIFQKPPAQRQERPVEHGSQKASRSTAVEEPAAPPRPPAEAPKGELWRCVTIIPHGVRRGPSLAERPVRRISPGEQVRILEQVTNEDAHWGRMTHEGDTEWVMLTRGLHRFMRRCRPTAEHPGGFCPLSSKALNVRSGLGSGAGRSKKTTYTYAKSGACQEGCCCSCLAEEPTEGRCCRDTKSYWPVRKWMRKVYTHGEKHVRGEVPPQEREERGLLVTAHPRGGTGTAASVLRRHGVEVKHEAMGEEGTTAWQLAAPALTDVPNWVDPPLMGRAKYRFRRVVHLVRNPYTAIPSVYHTEFYSAPFRASVLGEPLGCSVEHAARSFLLWHKMIRETRPDAVVRIERIDTDLPRAIGINPIPTNRSDGKQTRKNTSTFRGLAQPDYMSPTRLRKMLANATLDLLREFCTRYRYDFDSGELDDEGD